MNRQVREYACDREFERISDSFSLRPPQRDSLRVIHDIVRSLERDLGSTDQVELLAAARRINEDWSFPSGLLDLTFALATGVGKTRLMGAIAAYLYRTRQSRTFLFLAPRQEILRRLESEIRQTGGSYLFESPSIVPPPMLFTSDESLPLRLFDDSDTHADPPEVYLFSPQFLTTGKRVKAISAFTGSSIWEKLAGANDLVVFVDESHHLSKQELEQGASSWSKSIADLGPKAIVAMTGTPRPNVDIGNEYSLRACLRDRLYTKDVRIIVDDKANDFEPDDYDRFALRTALSRLEAKRQALQSTKSELLSTRPIRPVLLVAALDTKHADEVAELLVSEFNMSETSVLKIHSKERSEEDLRRLAEIESPESRVDVVVQVHVLDEGWDVSNVWVIAPLRNMNSFVNARQLMGRGLRLPFGRRTGDTELDTLDVLAFGQQTIEEVILEARADLGSRTVEIVKDAASSGESKGDPGGAEQDGAPNWFTSSARLELSLKVPLLNFAPQRPILEVEADLLRSAITDLRGFDASTLDTEGVDGFSYERSAFIDQTTRQLMELFPPLSAPRDEAALRALIEDQLREANLDGRDWVPLDPRLSARLLADRLSEGFSQLPPRFEETGLWDAWPIQSQHLKVPYGMTNQSLPYESDRGWNKNLALWPIGGWKRCMHDAARFDSSPEFELARRLDAMSDVEWWVRNDPSIAVFETTSDGARTTAPDFVCFSTTPRPLIRIIEVKGEMLDGPSSPARIRARDIGLWCQAATKIDDEREYRSVFVPSRAVQDIVTTKDLDALAVSD